MNIPQLLKYIELYNLGGQVEAVKFTVANKVLKTLFVTDDRNLAGSVTQKVFDVEDVEFGVWSTSTFRNRIKSLSGNEANISFVKRDNRVSALVLKDSLKVSANILLAEMSVIPQEEY